MICTVEELREIVDYDALTGALSWRLRPRHFFSCDRDWSTWNTRYAGKPAFSTRWKNGYLAGHLFKKTLLAHRVAWALLTGSWPEAQIDHINGRRADNRASNLRSVSPLQNQQNVKQRQDNTSGTKGVDFKKNTQVWRARMRENGRDVLLGYFTDKESAIAARKAAERDAGYHPNHGRAG